VIQSIIYLQSTINELLAATGRKFVNRCIEWFEKNKAEKIIVFVAACAGKGMAEDCGVVSMEEV
jgi:hypothetical protein